MIMIMHVPLKRAVLTNHFGRYLNKYRLLIVVMANEKTIRFCLLTFGLQVQTNYYNCYHYHNQYNYNSLAQPTLPFEKLDT